MVRLTDHPAMIIAVDLGRKATKQTKKVLLVINYLECCFVYFSFNYK